MKGLIMAYSGLSRSGFFSNILKNISFKRLEVPDNYDQTFGLRYYQERVFSNIFKVCILAMVISYFPSCIAAYHEGLFDIILINTLFAVWVFYIFYSTKISFSFKQVSLCHGIFVLSAFLLLRVGPHGGIALYFFIYPIISALFLGSKHANVSLCVSISVLAIFSLLRLTGVLTWYEPAFSNNAWFAFVGNYIFLSLAVVYAIKPIYRGLRRTINILEKRIVELKKTQEVTIECLASLAEYNDPETGAHINRTQLYVELLTNQMLKNLSFEEKLEKGDTENLAMSAPLHDIGKVGVPEHIINKPGKLTPAEFEEIKKHTTYGRDVLIKPEDKLGDDSFLKYARQMAHSHHEKWDGSGYPLGLKQEDIPLPGRIMAVADVYDALRTKRPYKPAFSHQKACDIITNEIGKHFDPNVTKAFFQLEKQFDGISNSVSDECEIIL